MKCEEARDSLVALAKGELEGDQKARLEDHLARCAGCTQELEDARKVLALTQGAEDSSVLNLAVEIVKEAISRRASDVHVDPGMEETRVRYRIDGVLHDVRTVEKPVGSRLVTRIKKMAEMNVGETRLPQDGRIPVKTREGDEYDLRVSLVPTLYGENAVLRILNRSSVLLGLDRLGLSEMDRKAIDAMIHRNDGIVIATGPVNAGKTTLLYSMMLELNDPNRSLATIEDPVEYALKGVTQVAVNRKAGLTFAAGVRSLLRQDPDILMVGENRDLETVELVCEAALTGRLVLTVLHTRDAVGALSRVLEIGAAPHVVGAAVAGIVGQRLVRTVCPDCKTPYEPDPTTLGAAGLPVGSSGTYVHGAGCEACLETGYQGRTGLFELLTIDSKLSRRIGERAGEEEIRDLAVNRGLLRSFLDDARAKVSAGVTTVEEVDRVLMLKKA